ncbi:hypothetical protein Poli38472_000611 [Pythium oligandrum]|uniref:Beta-Casp domain-containing protein n=1 Tax=Pythium oligandrum TaxID=41045 RepID=A0A8K1FH14_PYTOL|nr:hypothetical protein Poli38472_000611 [Pythium oligandrum]|eukprot:TMW60569.1 hypothetical protein Poli38472_000611 [Pythium oligandrum]
MSLTVERLGGGAAFLLCDESTRAAVLLGCGQVKTLGYLDASGASGRKGGDAESDEDGAVPSDETKYLNALKELVRRESEVTLQAVVITDYRPEACFMLPFLTEKCGLVSAQQPILPFPVVMTHGTRALGPHILAEYWSGRYGKSKDKSAMYDLNDIHMSFQRANGIAPKSCIPINDHVAVTAYHAGHVAGGCAFHIQVGSSSVLFVNDFNLGGGRVLQPMEIPRLRPSAMLTRSSFAVTVSETRTSMERDLTKAIYECVSAGGKVVIPVYRAGFVQEIMSNLAEYWRHMRLSCPIYLSDDVTELPGPFYPLLRRTYTKSYETSWRDRARGTTPPVPEMKRFDWKLLEKPGPYVLFTTPANISHGDSYRAIRVLAADASNLVVLSEYCKPGTINYMLFADPVRKAASKALGGTVACGVHYFPCSDEVDAKSIVELARQVRPHQVLLDYDVPEDMNLLKAHMETQLKASNEGEDVTVQGLSHTDAAVIQPTRQIPVRIHKSIFNNPNDVQGMLIAEAKRALVLVSTSNGARRLKKKRHTLSFQSTWKKPLEPLHRSKKRSSRAPSSALSFLLSGPAESADEDEPDEQPQPDLDVLDGALEEALSTWLGDISLEKANRWFKLRSVGVWLSGEWEAHMEWSYEDEELAGRILGIAKQVINAEYARKVEQLA